MASLWGRARLRPVTLVVVLVLVAVTLGAFFATRRSVADQERQLLAERADEVKALLGGNLNNGHATLGALGNVGASEHPDAAGLFERSVAEQVADGGAVEVAVGTGDRYEVVASAGEGHGIGAVLTGAHADLADRAVSVDSEQLVSALIEERGKTHLVLARAVDNGGAVAYQESPVVRQPVPSTPESPFRGLKVVLYAASEPDPDQFVVTTEADVPLTGEVRRVPLAVGVDEWTLAVGTRAPLAGPLAHNLPWIMLFGGLLIVVLVATVVESLGRRRAYAQDLVARRTGELEQAMEELAETRSFQTHLLTAGPVLVGRVSTADQQITYVSPNVERLLGISEEDARSPGATAQRLHPDDREMFEGSMRRIIAGDSTREVMEYRFLDGEDRYRWVSSTMVPETDEAGHVVAALNYLVDVDDRRRAGEALREAQAVAETANHAKSEFLSRMSHELRTPLNAVLGFGQILELEELTESQRDAVDHIVKGGRHLLDLINEVLDISRIETGDLALSPEPVLLTELVNEVAALMRPLAGQRGLKLVIERPDCCQGYVYADRQRTKQVLLNLVSNAVKYNRPHGTVALSCENVEGSSFRIAVTDTGMGIPAEQRERLFTAFERLGAEHTSEEGTGIGLALSKRLTEAMGGQLTVDSTLGRGSVFTVELPQVEGPVERYQRLTPATEANGDHPANGRTVLHIEDNLANLKLIERVLAQRPGVDVIPAMQGRLGLELAREHAPVLVLLDLHLPDMDGAQVLQRLRDDPATASIPVVIISADATPGQIGRLLNAGAAGYVTKPIDVREVLRHLDEAAAR